MLLSMMCLTGSLHDKPIDHRQGSFERRSLRGRSKTLFSYVSAPFVHVTVLLPSHHDTPTRRTFGRICWIGKFEIRICLDDLDTRSHTNPTADRDQDLGLIMSHDTRIRVR